jgi:hypothetical protein
VKITFINPPFKTEYGKFSRESRSHSIGHGGVLYYLADIRGDNESVIFHFN